MKYIIPSIVILIMGCVPITPTSNSSSKILMYDDLNYDEKVGLVQLYPISNGTTASIVYPVIKLSDPGLTVSFDIMEENSSYLNARYVHCNSDWSKSNLADLQFLNVYNEFSINNYSYSQNTVIPYVNYYSNLPTPTLSGNYLLVIYRDNDRDDILFSRRFMVFENRSFIKASIRPSSTVARRTSDQQIEFTVKHLINENPNPFNDFKVVLVQNHNWNSSIFDLKPTQIRQDQNTLLYEHFTGENTFPGINEFRFFDLRSVDYRGMNVAYFQKEPTGIQAYLGEDKTRKGLAYSQLIDDLNGGYYLRNLDPNDSQMQSEYVKVNFNLKIDETEDEIYIVGRWNDWQLLPENKMYYNFGTESYKGSALLKQGYYDYFYWIKGETEPFYQLEGCHYQTENNYEILFYYRNPFNNYDELIGYQLLNTGN